MSFRVAINGFGRIGRQFFRAAFDHLAGPESPFEIAAVNELCDVRTAAHLLRRDSVYGRFAPAVEARDNALIIDGLPEIAYLTQEDAGLLPWREMEIDLVLDATGTMRTREAAAAHLKAGAGRVLVSMPVPDADLNMVMGVNHADYDAERHKVLSASSCTCNCVAPVLKVLGEAFGIERAMTTNTHPYTTDQRPLDGAHPDVRRGRAAGLSIIPTSSGIAGSVALVLPEYAGRLQGVSLRVPTAIVSMIHLAASLKRPATTEELLRAFKAASETSLRGVLGYSDEPLVSADYTACPLSAVVDAEITAMASDTLARVSLWHDNEWGYACRLVDCVEWMGS